jgi:DNA polymerase (family 10)
MVTNRDAGRLFSLYAELLLLHNTNERLSSSLSGAAHRLRNINESVIQLSKEELIKVFRPEITSLIDGLKNSETIEALDELIQLTPQGLFEMMRIRGLGGKKLSVLWKKAGIDSINTLLEACKNNTVSKISGFGAKTQENIITEIEAYRSHKGRFHYASVADTAGALVQKLQRAFKTNLISLCGEVRRQTTTVAGIEILTIIPQDKINDKQIRSIIVIQSYHKERTDGHTLDEIPVTIYHTTKELFYYQLFERTGNERHVKKVSDKISSKAIYKSEQDIYKKAGLPYIFPEMREDVAEWNFTKKVKNLITLEDIKGVVHNHTNWSDGLNTLTDFVKACRDRSYEYVVISDHSKNAHYAGGLKEDKVLNQLEEIDKLNKKLCSFPHF